MKKIVKILRGIGYLAAFSLILYPVVSNYINQMNSTTIATDYEQEVSHLSDHVTITAYGMAFLSTLSLRRATL